MEVKAVSLTESSVTSPLHCFSVHIAVGPAEVVWLALVTRDLIGRDGWRVADNMAVEEMKVTTGS